MTCPTCASPLPAGAMFCGECGRAVTSADVAAQRASTGTGRRPADPPATTPPPAWRQRADRQVHGRDVEPWWVRERVEPDAAPGPASHHLGPAPGSTPEPTAAPTSAAPAELAEPGGPASPASGGPDLASWPPPASAQHESPGATSTGPDASRPGPTSTGPTSTGATGAESTGTEPVGLEPTSTGPTGHEPSGPEARGLGSPGPRTTSPDAEGPAVLRSPDRSADVPPPASAGPLWTASLAPLPEAPSAEPGGADGDERGGRAGVEGEGLGDQGRDADQVRGRTERESTTRDGDDGTASEAIDGTPADDGAVDGAVDPQTEIDLEDGRPAGGAPAPGDTALLERLLPDVAPAVPTSDQPEPRTGSGSAGGAVGDRATGAVASASAGADTPPAPPALVEPGSAEERCTQCGGPIHEDDIFCGECGAVVQSVARSFTGPVAPLAPVWRPSVPDAATSSAAEGTDADADADAEAGEAEAPSRPAPARGADSDEAPPAAEPSAPTSGAPAAAGSDPGRVRRSGRRARDVPPDGRQEARPVPESWSPPTVPVAPAPAAEAPPAGEDPDATKRRLVDEAARRALAWPPLGPDDALSAGDDAPRPPVDHVPGLVRAAPPEPPAAPSVPPSPQGASEDRASAWAAVRARTPRQVEDGPTSDADDVDETRIVARRSGAVGYGLQFSTGESVTVSGSGLLGRAPVAQPGERFEHLVRIVDPGKSVSKTHLEFGVEGGHLWVSDRWSGNGTLVRAVDEPPRRVQPGTRVRVPRGARVDIGEQFFLVQ